MNVQIRNISPCKIMPILNKSMARLDVKEDEKVYSMGMAACQGLCITYNLHSKRFCK